MKRILTAAVGIPFVLLVTIYAPLWLFGLFTGLVAAMAVDEFLTLGTAQGMARPGRWILGPACMVTAAFIGGAEWVVTALALTVAALMLSMIFGGPIESAFGKASITLGGILYCSVTLGFLVWLPRDFIITLFGIVWVGDSAAYYGGRATGRHPLAPRISPKKTIEGGIAGLIGSIMAGVLIGVWLLEEPWLRLAVISMITAIAGQLGDLAESVLKRSSGVKDSSSILPGHGGILDRLDSIFFAAPVFYWLFNV